MNPLVKRLKNCATIACRGNSRTRASLYEDFGFEDLLHRANDGNWNARQIATAMIWDCCCSDGKPNNSEAARKTLMLFLNEVFLPLSTMSAQDLGAILKGQATKAAIEKWAESSLVLASPRS